jgi:hypothetical protein
LEANERWSKRAYEKAPEGYSTASGAFEAYREKARSFIDQACRTTRTKPPAFLSRDRGRRVAQAGQSERWATHPPIIGSERATERPPVGVDRGRRGREPLANGVSWCRPGRGYAIIGTAAVGAEMRSREVVGK